jgi:hypothetical protein
LTKLDPLRGFQKINHSYSVVKVGWALPTEHKVGNAHPTILFFGVKVGWALPTEHKVGNAHPTILFFGVP